MDENGLTEFLAEFFEVTYGEMDVFMLRATKWAL